MNLALPMPQGSYLSDRFRAGDLECSAGIGSDTNVEFGVVGIINKDVNITTNPYQNGKEVGVYGRITIPIGGPKSRLNCDTLYQLELQKKRIEVLRLQQELANLKALQFENNNKK